MVGVRGRRDMRGESLEPEDEAGRREKNSEGRNVCVCVHACARVCMCG